MKSRRRGLTGALPRTDISGQTAMDDCAVRNQNCRREPGVVADRALHAEANPVVFDCRDRSLGNAGCLGKLNKQEVIVGLPKFTTTQTMKMMMQVKAKSPDKTDVTVDVQMEQSAEMKVKTGEE